MPDFRHDRIASVGFTLSKMTWMDVNVGNDLAPGSATVLPQLTKSPAIDRDDPCNKGMGVDIVVKDKLFDHAKPALPAEQKGTAFSSAKGSTTEFVSACLPD